MTYQVTVRYGATRKRYHLLTVEASDVAKALELAARELPEEVSATADLVEVRVAAEPEARRYVGEE